MDSKIILIGSEISRFLSCRFNSQLEFEFSFGEGIILLVVMIRQEVKLGKHFNFSFQLRLFTVNQRYAMILNRSSFENSYLKGERILLDSDKVPFSCNLLILFTILIRTFLSDEDLFPSTCWRRGREITC